MHPSETRAAEAVARDGARTQAAYLVSAYLALPALTLSPLLWASVPPLVDYPNHLARMWILVNAAKIPDLASNYVADWRLLPNLAMDLVVPALALILPVETAGRVFIAITMLLLVGGTAALHRALHGRVGLWPLCSLLFIYNAALFWGLLNFLFGTGVFLLAFGAWVATRKWRPTLRIAAFSIVATLLFILHLFAFGLYGLSVMSYELGARLRRQGWSPEALRGWISNGIQFVPAISLWLWLRMSATGAEPTYTAYGSVIDRMYTFVAPVTFGRPIPLDIVFIAFFGIFVLYAVHGRSSLRILPEMRLPLLVLAVAAMLIPNWLSGSWLADVRVPVALPFIFLASTQVGPMPRPAVRAFVTAAVVLLAVRVWATSKTWRDYDTRFTEFRSASRVITSGSRLLFVEGPLPPTDRHIPGVPEVLASRWERSFSNMGTLAVIDRGAFVPGLFLTWTPVSPTTRNAGLFSTSVPLPDATPEMLLLGSNPHPQPNGSADHNELRYWQDWPRHFDFVLWVDFGRPPPLPIEHLELTFTGSFFRIYRVLRP